MASLKLFQITILVQLICSFTGSYQNSTNVLKIEDVMYEVKSRHRVALVDDEAIVFRVVNGHTANLGEVPYQVAIMQKTSLLKYSTVCGGAIIGPKTILTAAHCVVIKKPFDNICCQEVKGHMSQNRFREKRVVAGQLKSVAEYGINGQWRRIKSGRYPKSYIFPVDDIAVLELFKRFNYDHAVQPIPYAKELIDYNLTCVVSGYGRTKWLNDKAVNPSPFLMIAEMRTLLMKKCKRIHTNFVTLSETAIITKNINFDKIICTSDHTSDVAKGDSGGPLVCKRTGDPAEIFDQSNNTRGVLVGVVSAKRFDVTFGTIFTRVSYFSDFIESSATRLAATTWFLCFNYNLFVLYIIFIR